MPIYEYECQSCHGITTALILKPEQQDAVRCEHCAGEQVTRIVSRFAVHKTETQRLRELDTRAPRGDDFYKDSRNVGLWAKKRAQELGADLGPQYDEVVEKARTTKHVEDLTT